MIDEKILRLLLIEDSEDDEFLLVRHLRKNDFAVKHHRVQTPQSLKTALEQNTWDIILSDYSMPNFTGMDALEIVKSYDEDLPFIMVSGAIGEERAAQMMKAGASDYITKGNYARLIPAIERELRDYARRIQVKISEAQIYKLSNALAQSANLVIVFNLDGMIDYVNEAFVRTMGYMADEIYGKTANFLRVDGMPDEVYDAALSEVLFGREWRGELLNRKKNGDLFPVQMTISIIRDENNEITHYLAVQEDITERKQLEAEVQRYTESLQDMVEERTRQLRVTLEQLEAILENSSDGIVLALASGDIVTTNPAFHRFFDGNVTRSIEEIIHLLPREKDIKSFADALISVIYDSTAERTQTNFVTEDGVQLDLDLAFVPVKSKDGQVEGVVMSVRDITPVKDLERFKTEFIANAVHDLANPIAALKMRLYLLKAKPDDVNKHTVILERQIDRMERLVDELRLLAAFDRGVIDLEKQETDISELIEVCIESHEPIATAKNIRIDYQLKANFPLINVDPGRFERIIVNLVSNAITYTKQNGVVTIRADYEPNQLTFEVEDSGIGIEEDAQSRIFERFFRTSRARSENDRGTGLGLAIVKEIVEAHGGTVSIESRVDIGTRFTVLLPR